MNGAEPYDGRVYLADKSAWVRARDPAVRDEWQAAILAGQIATCAVVKLELLYSTRSAEEYSRWDERLSALRNVPVTETVCRAALTAMRELAERSDGYHRASPPDYLIAAAAQDVGVGVLHYDEHYDRLAESLNFESRWIAPRGTLA